jgi:ATP-dependent Lon protease
MEIIDISGYVAEEKLAIAQKYLIPQVSKILTGTPDPELEVMDPDPALDPELDLNRTKNHKK